MWSIGVLLSSDGVRVRNFLLWTGRFILWSDIDRFDWGKLQRGPSFFFLGPFRDGYPTGGAYLRSGAFVPSLALNPPLGPGDTIWRLFEQLNGELARAHAAAGLPVTKLDSVAPMPLAFDDPNRVSLPADDTDPLERSQN